MKRILHIDDESQYSNQLRDVLKFDLEYEVVAIESTDVALEMIRAGERGFVCIISDRDLWDGRGKRLMSGEKFLTAVKELLGDSCPTLFLCTGSELTDGLLDTLANIGAGAIEKTDLRFNIRKVRETILSATQK